MGRTRLFRNDGLEMVAEEPAELEYIDPGIVLLYADTDRRVVCSYLEGRLGQPIQATVERTYDSAIDLSGLKDSVHGLDVQELRLSSAPEDDPSSPRWALDGLEHEPLSVGELQREIIRRLLGDVDEGCLDNNGDRHPVDGGGLLPGNGMNQLSDTTDKRLNDGSADSVRPSNDPKGTVRWPEDGSRIGWIEPGMHTPMDLLAPSGVRSTFAIDRSDDRRGDQSDHSSAGGRNRITLDFAVRNVYDGARFFTYLVETFSEERFTVAVSKAGRIDVLRQTDVVIHVDADRLADNERVVPIEGTDDIFETETARFRQKRVVEQIAEPLADLRSAYADVSDAFGRPDGSASPAPETSAEPVGVLQRVLDDWLQAETPLQVVDAGRERYRRRLRLVVGLAVGLALGVVGSDALSAHTAALVDWLRTDVPAQVEQYRSVLAPVIAQSSLTSVVMGTIATLCFVCVVVVRRRHGASVRTRSDGRDVRSDLVSAALNIAAAISLLVLVGSMLWYAAGG